MIQRKQSVFLLLAFIASVVCLCLRIGDIEPAGMGVGFKLYNLMLDKGASVDYSPCGLFGILLISSAMSLATIFLYRNRKLQSSLCLCNVVYSARCRYTQRRFGRCQLPHCFCSMSSCRFISA